MNCFEIWVITAYVFPSGPFLPSKALLPIFNKFFLSANNNFKEAVGMMKGWLTACGKCMYTVVLSSCGSCVVYCMFLLFGERPTSTHCSWNGSQ